MNGTLVRGGDWERFWFVCVLPLQAAHKVFAGKRGEFFFKRRWKQSDCCFSVRFSFSLSLSLSAFFLISALLSDDEKKNHRARFFFFFFFFWSSSFPCFVGEVLLLKTTPRTPFLSQSGRVCFGRFAHLLAYFLFWLLLSFGFGLCSAFYFGRTSFLSPEEDSFPLYPMRGKHIKVFIITHNI